MMVQTSDRPSAWRPKCWLIGKKQQVPGIYRRRVGDALVTVVNDGFLDIPFEILRGTPRDRM